MISKVLPSTGAGGQKLIRAQPGATSPGLCKASPGEKLQLRILGCSVQGLWNGSCRAFQPWWVLF